MRISILAVGTRLRPWVYEGFDSYKKRFPPHIQLHLEEIPAGKRASRGDAASAIKSEGEQLLRRTKTANWVIALDEKGKQMSTMELAEEMREWLDNYSQVALLIGGPDGLADQCKTDANCLWSLSRLTLPHGLVRVMLAEQLYRGWTVLEGHPYHRP